MKLPKAPQWWNEMFYLPPLELALVVFLGAIVGWGFLVLLFLIGG